MHYEFFSTYINSISIHYHIQYVSDVFLLFVCVLFNMLSVFLNIFSAVVYLTQEMELNRTLKTTIQVSVSNFPSSLSIILSCFPGPSAPVVYHSLLITLVIVVCRNNIVPLPPHFHNGANAFLACIISLRHHCFQPL